jgi:hypothetical protein
MILFKFILKKHNMRVQLAQDRYQEYQESSWVVNGGRCIRLTNLPPSVGRLVSQPYEPSSSVTVIALPFYLLTVSLKTILNKTAMNLQVP